MDVINHSLQNPHQEPLDCGTPSPPPKIPVRAPDAPRKSRTGHSRIGRDDTGHSRCKMVEKCPTGVESADYIPLTQASSIKTKVEQSKDCNRIRSRSSSPLLCRQYLNTDDEDTVGYSNPMYNYETVYTRPTPANSPTSTKYPSSEKIANLSRTASDEDLYQYAEAMEYLENVSTAARFLLSPHTPKIKNRTLKEYDEATICPAYEAFVNDFARKKLNFDDIDTVEGISTYSEYLRRVAKENAETGV